MAEPPLLPPETFDRMDDTPDGDFYRLPRLVAHIDPGTIEALTAYVRLVPGDEKARADLDKLYIAARGDSSASVPENRDESGD